jgi:hypothetical protein
VRGVGGGARSDVLGSEAVSRGGVGCGGRATVALFYRLMWPVGEPRPTVYFDPRAAEHGSLVSLHAKCVFIDYQYTLIRSANFTDRGQTRSLEAGVAIEDREFAASLERQWGNLVSSGVVAAQPVALDQGCPRTPEALTRGPAAHNGDGRVRPVRMISQTRCPCERGCLGFGYEELRRLILQGSAPTP